jgi:RHS repeat-associated protein
MQDANWNVTAIADTSATVQERYAYASYGMPTFMTPAFGSLSGSNFAWETLFAGYRWDNTTNLYNVRTRELAPNLGVWVHRDTVFNDSMNLYEYVGSRPTTAVDPTGEAAWVPICCGTCAATLSVAVGVPAAGCYSSAQRYRNDPLGYISGGQRLRGSDAVNAAFWDCIVTYYRIQSRTHHIITTILAISSCVCCGITQIRNVLNFGRAYRREFAACGAALWGVIGSGPSAAVRGSAQPVVCGALGACVGGATTEYLRGRTTIGNVASGCIGGGVGALISTSCSSNCRLGGCQLLSTLTGIAFGCISGHASGNVSNPAEYNAIRRAVGVIMGALGAICSNA